MLFIKVENNLLGAKKMHICPTPKSKQIEPSLVQFSEHVS